MTWTYLDPRTSAKDAVRLLVGDTDKAAPQREDEEITFALTECAGNIYLSGALICDTLAAKYTRDSDKTVGDVREHLAQVSRAYAARAKELRERATQGQSGIDVIAVAPFVGGISVARTESGSNDTDLIQSAFRPGMFDAV